jgi:hypothetical protein
MKTVLSYKIKERRLFILVQLLNILVFLLIKLGIAPYMRFYKTKEIEKQISNCGFKIIETESYINHN